MCHKVIMQLTGMSRGPSSWELGDFSHLGLFLRHHVQFLLTHPSLGFSCIKVVLLGFVCLLEPSMALLGLLNEQPPQLLQVGKSLPDSLSIEAAAICDDILTPLKDVINTRLVSLDFFLEGLCRRGKSSFAKWPWPDTY